MRAAFIDFGGHLDASSLRLGGVLINPVLWNQLIGIGIDVQSGTVWGDAPGQSQAPPRPGRKVPLLSRRVLLRSRRIFRIWPGSEAMSLS